MPSRIAIVAVAVIGFLPQHAGAQTTSFADLEPMLKGGSTVYVQTVVGPQGHAEAIKGRTIDVSGKTLRLLVADGQRDFDERDVVRIWQRHRTAGKGALWGLAVGAGVGVAMTGGLALTRECAARGGSDSCGWAPLEHVFVGVVSGYGAGIGALIGVFRIRERTLFATPGAASSFLAVTPVIGAGRAGLAATFGF